MTTALSVLSNPVPFEVVGYRTFPGYFPKDPRSHDFRIAVVRVEASERTATLADLLVLEKIVGLLPVGGYNYPLAKDYRRALERVAYDADLHRNHGYIFTHNPDPRHGRMATAYGIPYNFSRNTGKLKFLDDRHAPMPKTFPAGCNIIFGYDPSVGTEMVFGKGTIPT